MYKDVLYLEIGEGFGVWDIKGIVNGVVYVEWIFWIDMSEDYVLIVLGFYEFLVVID